MATPIGGAFARQAQPVASARIWGSGINAVHSYYGSPPLRETPWAPREGQQTPPFKSVPQQLLPSHLWGYTEPPSPHDLVTDGRPAWDVPPEESPSRYSTRGMPPWSAPGWVNEAFRAAVSGAHRVWRGKYPRAKYRVPTETVSEGWLNKPNFGPVAVAKPSDPSQYEMQTSMAQRFQVRHNAAAVARGTADPASPIASRVVPQRSPVYSGGLRHYDMFPVQQTPWRIRPFFYRTAGTGFPEMMAPNETYDIEPIQRVVPPDPSLGEDETGLSDYGYSPEDRFYA